MKLALLLTLPAASAFLAPSPPSASTAMFGVAGSGMNNGYGEFLRSWETDRYIWEAGFEEVGGGWGGGRGGGEGGGRRE